MIQKQKKIYLRSVILITAVIALSSCGKAPQTTSGDAPDHAKEPKVESTLEVKTAAVAVTKKNSPKNVESLKHKVLKFSNADQPQAIEKAVPATKKKTKANTTEMRLPKTTVSVKKDSVVKTTDKKPKKGFKFSFVQGTLGLWRNPWRKSSGLLSVRF